MGAERWISRVVPGLSVRLLLLVVLACSPLVALTLHASWEDRRRARENWRQQSQRLMQLVRREEDKVILATRQLLMAVSQSSAVRATNARACQRLVEHLYGSYPRYANLGVVTTNGTVIASAIPLLESANQSGRRYFQRALRTRSFAMGNLVPGSSPNSTATITCGLPVMRSSEVLAVVFATLDLDWYTRFGSELPKQVPAGSTWSELGPQGKMLLQYSAAGAVVPHRIPRSAIAHILSEPRGLVEYADPMGVVHVGSFISFRSRLGNRKVVAVLSRPKEALFARADHALVRNLVWMGSALGMALVIGWVGSRFLVLRPVRAVVQSSSRLAAGDLSARIGLPYGRDELGALTRAFDRMAQALEQRELEQQKANYKLQVLSRRLVEVQESERRHLARELHDEIGQALTAADLNIRATIAFPDSTPLVARLNASLDLIRGVLEKVQDISLNLRPSMLDDLGLVSAIRWYTARQAEISGLQAEFHADTLERRLDPVIETECFRIIQEALTNVVRHASASRASVHLTQRSGLLHLRVRDDGCGFDPAALRDRAVRGESLGLLSMEERAALVGGHLELESRPGEGTQVRVWIPLKYRNDATS